MVQRVVLAMMSLLMAWATQFVLFLAKLPLSLLLPPPHHPEHLLLQIQAIARLILAIGVTM
jgi:hypothetical protein